VWRGGRAVRSSCSTLCNAGYKFNSASGAGKDSASIYSVRIGPREKEVLKRIVELGLVIFRPIDLGLNWDKRRINDVLRRLMSKGLIEKVQRGLYRVVDRMKLIQVLIDRARHSRARRLQADGAGKDSQGRGSHAAVHHHGIRYTVEVEGPYLDNVDGLTWVFKRIRGDRVDRDWKDLVFFRKISWCEILYRVKGVEIFGQLRVYQKHGVVRVEWQPPSGFIKSNGLESGLRMYWEMVLNLFKILIHLILQKGPLDVKQRMLKAIVNAGLKSLICV